MYKWYSESNIYLLGVERPKGIKCGVIRRIFGKKLPIIR